MKTIDKSVQEFIERLRQTEEWRLYEKKREAVGRCPGLREEINAYRKKNYMLQQSGEELFDRVDEFAREYEQFRSNPVVEEYLQAELAMCRLLQRVYTQIAEAIDLDIYLDL